MARSSAPARFLARLRTVENLVIALAAVLALPMGLAVSVLANEQAAGFFLLLLVGIAVPSAYERHWRESYPTRGTAAAWTVVASAIGTGAYLGIYWLVRSAGGGGLASAGIAFVLAWGFALLVETVRRRRGGGDDAPEATE